MAYQVPFSVKVFLQSLQMTLSGCADGLGASASWALVDLAVGRSLDAIFRTNVMTLAAGEPDEVLGQHGECC